MDFEGRSLKSQMSLADRLGAAMVVIMGDQEMAEDKAVLRHMATGGQEVLPLDELVPGLKARLGHKEGNITCSTHWQGSSAPIPAGS